MSFFHSSSGSLFFSELPPERQAAIKKAIFAGNKIEAIKLYRAAKGCDLATAKEAVDVVARKLAEESPGRFKSPQAAASSAKGGGCGGAAALLLLGAGGLLFKMLNFLFDA